ncbi:hypothetical protein [Gorillibacterium massiliense]|uniref:hypothetical protein n=1 Tax=Gorillibacterium massiliense TaxID=1280390 RepID=UPI0004B9422C|nr:hypothetical protein [Gorillibacterium massiliense]
MVQQYPFGYYQAFGLTIRSEIALPDVLSIEERQGEADVDIRIGDLDQDWQLYGDPDDYYAYHENQLLLYVPDLAIYRVREGRDITVMPFEKATEDSICLYLLGTCMAAILMQRRILPLHGSAVMIDGKAYAFVGDSGAGKSTLAAAFLQSGYPLVTDDVIAVKLNDSDGKPEVIPGYPQQKLWQQSLELLGMDAAQYKTIYETKYAIPVAAEFSNRTAPLAGIFELNKTEDDQLEIDPCQGLNRLPLLVEHTFRNFMIPELADGQWHFSTIVKVGSGTRMYRLKRPAAGFSTKELVERILRTVNEGA